MGNPPPNRAHEDLYRSSQASCPPDDSQEINPFEHALDSEEEQIATVPPAAVKTVIPAPSQAVLVPQASPSRLQNSLLQCPFCQSVFRSTVAGQLDLCPVCAAVAKVPGDSASTDVAVIPARLNRSGTPPVLTLHRSYKRVGLGVRGNSESSSKRGSWNRLLWMAGAGLLVCGVIGVLAGLFYSKELAFHQCNPADEKYERSTLPS